ncbi:hypothetical protein JOQ06_000145, partial [Pogonophryne albipinna]
MSYTDFLRHYSRVEVCTLTPDTIDDDSVKHWSVTKLDGSWRKGSTAGGCRNHPYSFWMNPQIVIKLEEEDDDPDDGEVGCSFVVGLIQKNRRKLRKQGEDMHTVGFAIYDLPKQFYGQREVHLDKNFFLTHAQTAKSETFTNQREVSTRFKLPPGEYLIVPSTFEPHLNGDFCVRVFSEKQAETLPCDDPVSAELEDETVSDEEVDSGFRGLFTKLAGDDMEISAVELRTIMNKIVSKRTDIKTDGFSMETSRIMVNLMDDSGNGRLGLGEFATLWKKVQRYLTIYKQNDMDNSGTMSTPEMRVAFKDAVKKDSMPTGNVATSDVSMAALTSLLESHKVSLSTEFKTVIAALESKIDLIHATISDHGQRITSLESNADLVDGRLSTLEATCAELAARNAKLRAKTADLEARSRRKNIRIIGLPESIEGPRPTAFFSDLLPQLLGDQILPTSPELVRAHRSLAAKPKPGERQRTVIIRFHNFQTKERVIREARKMTADLRYEGKPIAFYEYYILEVVMQRALYREVMTQLYKLGLRPALQYLAKLMITAENGDKLSLRGFTLNNTIYQLLVARYSDPDMTIDFDNFVGCLMRLEMMFKIFKKLDPHESGSIELDFNA